MNNYRILTDPDHIQPLTNLIDLDAQYKLADQLHEMVAEHDMRNHLRKRHLLGVLARHGASEQASQKAVVTARTLQHQEELDVFVLRGHDQEPLGMATVDPTVKVRALTFEMPPILARGRLSRPIRTTGPEIAAWVKPDAAPEAGDVLATAYKVLSDPQGPARKMFKRFAELHPASASEKVEPVQAFTIEPLASGRWIRDVLISADFHVHGAGNYDDGESRRVPVSRSYYYVAPALAATT